MRESGKKKGGGLDGSSNFQYNKEQEHELYKKKKKKKKKTIDFLFLVANKNRNLSELLTCTFIIDDIKIKASHSPTRT